MRKLHHPTHTHLHRSPGTAQGRSGGFSQGGSGGFQGWFSSAGAGRAAKPYGALNSFKSRKLLNLAGSKGRNFHCASEFEAIVLATREAQRSLPGRNQPALLAESVHTRSCIYILDLPNTLSKTATYTSNFRDFAHANSSDDVPSGNLASYANA